MQVKSTKDLITAISSLVDNTNLQGELWKCCLRHKAVRIFSTGQIDPLDLNDEQFDILMKEIASIANSKPSNFREI